MGTGVLSLGYSGRVLNVTTLHLVLRVRKNEALPLFPLYAFTKLKGTTLPIPLTCSCSVYVHFLEQLHNTVLTLVSLLSWHSMRPYDLCFSEYVPSNHCVCNWLCAYSRIGGQWGGETQTLHGKWVLHRKMGGLIGAIMLWDVCC